MLIGGLIMSNLLCTACNQRKKEENFSQQSILNNTPVCAGCDVKMLMRRIEISKDTIMAAKKQQQAVVEVAKTLDSPPKKPIKTTSLALLKGILQGGEGALMNAS